MQLWKNTALTSVAALLGLFLLPLAVAGNRRRCRSIRNYPGRSRRLRSSLR